MISAAAPLADVARSHRERWIAARCGDREIVRLDGGGNLLADVRAATERDAPGALVLEGLPEGGLDRAVVDALSGAAERGWGVVVAVPGGGDVVPTAPTAEPEAVAAALAARLPGGAVIPQRLAEVSIISDGAGPLTAPLDGLDADAADVETWLVVGGLAEPDADEPIAVAIGTVHRAYARWLDAANAALRRANVRMARERLGTHDAAAATTARRIRDAEAERDAARDELNVVRNDAMQYFQITQRKLNLPHYRIAEGIAQRAGRVPGARRVGKAVVRRVLPPGPGD
jgi:hypothetical protein